MFLKLTKIGILTFLVLSVLLSIFLFGGYLYLVPRLPSIEGLSDVRLQVPLRIYSSEGSLLGEFGEKKRTPKTLDEIPELMKQAFLAAEDDRFFEHPGVDYQGILRAAFNLIRTGERGQGGSTITMQLARNFYLSSEKTYMRKISEILLAFKIEEELTKNKILELYLNKIYLGNRSYGVAAASQTYYGVHLDELSLPQIAMIAGLPKAPSRYNPLVNPERALTRRDYVLSRLLKLEHISVIDYEQARMQPILAKRHLSQVDVNAQYVNEMVRAEIVKQFGDEAYARGLRVYTTLQDRLQQAANDSVWNGLIGYDRRHGYRGVIRHVEFEESLDGEQVPVDVAAILEKDRDYGRLKPALVLELKEGVLPQDETLQQDIVETAAKETIDKVDQQEPQEYARLALKSGDEIILKFEGVSWAGPYVSLNRMGEVPTSIKQVLKAGDVIWVFQNKLNEWELGQAPEVQGALVAISPNDGAIRALKGGFNYSRSNFNRVVQSKRQAGSSFKPVIYSSALAKSYTAASIINDAPVVFEDKALEGAWRPENYSGKFYGPTRLREALVKSRNLVSIRLLRDVGVKWTTRFATKFGIKADALPHDLSLALGSGELSPLELARVFSVFANGGYLIQPYFIQRIVDPDDEVLFEADPVVACVSCVLAEQRDMQPALKNLDEEEAMSKLPKQAEQTLEPKLVYLMDSILQDVIKRGTGRRALSLGRKDLAGKTGTTNDQRDAWFNGYNRDLVAIAWVGFDQLKPLGNRETGSKAALPVWIDFMQEALRGVPEKQLPRPDGMVTVKINAETGEAATDTDKNTVFEIFRAERSPVAGKGKPATGATSPENSAKGNPIPEQLF